MSRAGGTLPAVQHASGGAGSFSRAGRSVVVVAGLQEDDAEPDGLSPVSRRCRPRPSSLRLPPGPGGIACAPAFDVTVGRDPTGAGHPHGRRGPAARKPGVASSRSSSQARSRNADHLIQRHALNERILSLASQHRRNFRISYTSRNSVHPAPSCEETPWCRRRADRAAP